MSSDLRSSPKRLAAGGDIVVARDRMVGRGGLTVLRLVRKDLQRQAWQGEVESVSTPCGSCVFGPHERAVASSEQELGIHESAE